MRIGATAAKVPSILVGWNDRAEQSRVGPRSRHTGGDGERRGSIPAPRDSLFHTVISTMNKILNVHANK